MTHNELKVVYWDASAVLSALFRDVHSEKVHQVAAYEGIHFMSTLAYAETCAVISRMRRDRVLVDILIKAALEAMDEGPWHRLNARPEWGTMLMLSEKWPLRGADLWHLSVAKTVQKDLPELLSGLDGFWTVVVYSGSGYPGKFLEGQARVTDHYALYEINLLHHEVIS